MRLVPGILILAVPALWAEGQPKLPWEGQAPLAWQVEAGEGAPEPVFTPPSSGPWRAQVTGDGTVRVLDPKGMVRLQAGLPGRPLKAWRDGGLPLAAATGDWTFPGDAPLTRGLGAFPWGATDARPFLRGLLWLLEDGEGFLTVVHPGTGRLLHLPLPPGHDLELRFRPDRLDVVARDVEPGAPRRWSLSWAVLLPRLAALGPDPNPPKAGTALAPYPKEG